MSMFKNRYVLSSILLGFITIFGLSVSHLNISMSDHMMGMDSHVNAAACQNICTYADTSVGQQRVTRFEHVEEEPRLLYLSLVVMSIIFVTLLLLARRLYSLSSWKPPDIVLLTGKYSTSL